MINNSLWTGVKCESCDMISGQDKFDSYFSSQYCGETLSGRRVWRCGKCVFDERAEAAKTLKEVMVGNHGVFKNLKIGQE